MPSENYPFHKNQEIILTIDDLGVRGEGIGHYDSVAVFVEGALPGEEVLVLIIKCAKTYAVGKLLEILRTSPARVAPSCPCFPKCGGCQLQHLSYEAELEYKRRKIQNALERIGGLSDVVVPPVASAVNQKNAPICAHYRNKAQFPIAEVCGRLEAGFYASRSHRLVPSYSCEIQNEKANELICQLCAKARELGLSAYNEESGKGLLRHILIRTLEDISVTFVINGDALPKAEKWIEYIPTLGIDSFSININKSRDNVILGEKTIVLYGQETVRTKIRGLTLQLSPESFLQVNSEGTELLYAYVREFLEPNSSMTLLDAYCGVGSIGLSMAACLKKLVGVEIVEPAIINARENARLNEIVNADFYVGAAEQIVPQMVKERMYSFDAVVVDPPRSGCDKAMLDALLCIAAEKLIYVSCDPATLARDLQYLCVEKNAYKLKKVQGVNMFPRTGHVETVVLMSRDKE